jgi:hypothetical protein
MRHCRMCVQAVQAVRCVLDSQQAGADVGQAADGMRVQSALLGGGGLGMAHTHIK